MRVLLLSTDCRVATPRGAHVLEQVTTLSMAGADVEVLTCDEADAGAARITRVMDHPPIIEAWERSRWAMQFCAAMLERATVSLITRGVDVVHAHDWEVSWAARAAARLAGAPLVATLHSTESGRTGLGYDDSALIEDAERALCRDAAAVVAITPDVESVARAWTQRVEPATTDVIALYRHSIERHTPRARPLEPAAREAARG